MGKKNKTAKEINSEEDVIKPKIKKNKYIAKDEITTDISELVKNITSNKKGDRKNKKSSVSDDTEFDSSCHGKLEVDITDNFDGVVDKEIITKKKDKKKKSKAHEQITSVDSSKLKKIKTTDLVVKKQVKSKNKTSDMEGDSATQEKTVINNKRKFLNEDEAEVKDEDIDKFCDELTEEDNATYENWVKLFEANFKKTKNSQ